MHRFFGCEASQVSPSGAPKGESVPAIESPPTRNNSRRDQPSSFVMAFTLLVQHVFVGPHDWRRELGKRS